MQFGCDLEEIISVVTPRGAFCFAVVSEAGDFVIVVLPCADVDVVVDKSRFMGLMG